MKTNGQARGARWVEGTGITDLRPLADSLDTYARQIHSIAEIIRSIEEESAEQSTEAKAAENTAPCSLHDGQQHLTSTPVISDTLDRTPVIEAHAAPVVDTISPEAIWQRVLGARKATEARTIEWMPDKVYQDGCAAVGRGELGFEDQRVASVAALDPNFRLPFNSRRGDLPQDLIAIGSAEEKPGQNARPLVDLADKGDGPESAQHGLRDADMDLAALRLSSRGWRTFPSTDDAMSMVELRHRASEASSQERLGAFLSCSLSAARLLTGSKVLQAAWFAHRWFCWIEAAARNSLGRAWSELKTYVDVLTGEALRQSNARLLALVLAILVGVIGTLVILAVWLSPTPEQIQAARNGQGKQGTQQSTPAGDAQPSLLGQYGEYEQSASTPAPEQSAAARAPEQSTSTPASEQSTSTPASEQPRGWIAEVKKSRPICESADDYVQIQRMAFHIAQRPSRAAARKAAEFVKRKCPIITFKPGNHASVERTETFSIDKTRSITLACVVVKDGPCAWTDASALVRIPEEAPAKKSSVKNSEAIEWAE
jgi:hypothetical protein